MALTYDAALKDQVAVQLTRGVYSDLSPAQKIAIDGDGEVGAAGRALSLLGQYANFFTGTDTATIPDSWESWFISEAVMQASPAFPTSEGTDVRRNNVSARRDALLAYSRVDMDSTADGSIGDFDILSLRTYVVTHAIRHSPSVFLEPSIVDDAIEEAVVDIWNEADWRFKTKLVTLTIGTDSTVTASDSVAVDKIIGDRIYYDSDEGFAISVDYPTITDYAASSPTAAKPAYFHLLRSGDALDWIFDRSPDQEYTAKVMVTQQTPTMSGQTTMNAALASFPTDFRSILRNRVLGVALSRTGQHSSGDRLMAETDDKIHGLLSRYDNGSSEDEWSEHNNVRPFGMGFNGGHIGGGGL